MTFPTIKTKRLRLVAPSLDYAADVFAYASDPEFCRYIGAKPCTSIEDARAFLANIVADNREGRRLYWLIEYEGKVIGSLGFNFLPDLEEGTVDFGYGIGCAWHGKGLFNEAARAVIDHGFNALKFSCIQAATRADNLKSIEGVRRLGFSARAPRKGYYKTESGPVDCAVLILLRE